MTEFIICLLLIILVAVYFSPKIEYKKTETGFTIEVLTKPKDDGE